ncbi:MAG: nucleoside monophosphate kinase [bacterium]
MNPQLFVFFGRSGCGKGTQASLLTKYLDEKDPKAGVFYVSTGDEFRKLISGDTYTGKRLRSIVEGGQFAPEFLASMLWANVMTRDYKEGMHMIIDGSPRKIPEALVFDSVAPFYGFGKVKMIYMNVSSEWATDKALKRAEAQGRKDDTVEAVAKRMKAFDDFLYPVILSYKENPNVDFREINGEQTIEKVHQDIMSALELSI